jgi:uncharacterized protein GlcG (DUF336 family)
VIAISCGHKPPAALRLQVVLARIVPARRTGTRCRPQSSTHRESSRSSSKATHSTIHTQDTSFRKAYTLVTFGPIFNLDTTSQIAELAKNPTGPGPALTSIPNVLALAGGVAIKRNNEIVATLGVGGSPGGAKDEACAEAGVAKIHDRVEAAAEPRSRSADVKK